MTVNLNSEAMKVVREQISITKKNFYSESYCINICEDIVINKKIAVY